MFSVLEIIRDAPERKKRIRDRFRGPDVTAQYISVKGGTPFCRISARLYRGVVPWYSIAAKASGCLLVPADELPPQDAQTKHFSPQQLPQRLLLNSAYLAVKKMKLPPTKVFLTIFDESGELNDLTAKFVMLARGVRIITACPQKYYKLRDELMHSYGFSLIVGENVDSSVLASTVIISYSSQPFFSRYKGILFTGSVCAAPFATVMRGEGIELDGELSQYIPAGIDPVDFACALYEKCGVRCLGDTCFAAVRALPPVDAE